MNSGSPELIDLREEYLSVPHTRIPSYEPYGSNNPAARAEAMDDFIHGNQEWPSKDYPKLDTPPLADSERRYLSILSAVVDHEQEEGETPQSALLYETVARKLAEVYRHSEAKRLLGTVATDAVDLSRSRAANMSGELFGEPDVESFDALLNADIKMALEAQNSTDPERSRIATEYMEHLNLTPEQIERRLAEAPAEKSYELQDETIEIIRADIYELFPGLEEAMASFMGRTGSTAAVEAKPAFWAALTALGLVDKGWIVRLVDGKKAAETTGRNREITYGRDRADFTPTSVFATPIHEAFHALRYQNGTEQDEPHRRSALPGSLAFEEGFMTVIEQIMSGVKRVPGEKYYLQLGLLKGLQLPEQDRGERSFRTVYELMWRRAALQESKPLTYEKIKSLEVAAYRSVDRTARGNARDTRDISYFEGARKATVILNETARMPKEVRLRRLRWMLSGVFDPTDTNHAEMYGGDPARS